MESAFWSAVVITFISYRYLASTLHETQACSRWRTQSRINPQLMVRQACFPPISQNFHNHIRLFFFAPPSRECLILLNFNRARLSPMVPHCAFIQSCFKDGNFHHSIHLDSDRQRQSLPSHIIFRLFFFFCMVVLVTAHRGFKLSAAASGWLVTSIDSRLDWQACHRWSHWGLPRSTAAELADETRGKKGPLMLGEGNGLN